jgi:hypothetical protein
MEWAVLQSVYAGKGHKPVKAEKGVPEMYFACTLQTLGEQMDF